MRKFLLAMLAAIVISGGACVGYDQWEQRQPKVIGFDPGGSIGEFIENYDELRRSGRHVILDGICISACTLIAGLLPAKQVCVTPYAKLAFHSAFLATPFGRVHSSEGTRLIWQIYPERLRILLRERGFDGGNAPAANEHPDLVYVEGADLLGIFPAC